MKNLVTLQNGLIALKDRQMLLLTLSKNGQTRKCFGEIKKMGCFLEPLNRTAKMVQKVNRIFCVGNFDSMVEFLNGNKDIPIHKKKNKGLLIRLVDSMPVILNSSDLGRTKKNYYRVVNLVLEVMYDDNSFEYVEFEYGNQLAFKNFLTKLFF